jgi:outer membrane protein TolC
VGRSTATYRQTVLTAFQQVEDSLSDLHHLGDEDAAEHRAVTNAEQAAQLSMNRYNKGASSYLDVVTAQTTELTARRKALQVETSRLQAGVALVRALGGGWQRPRVSTSCQRGTGTFPPEERPACCPDD